MKRLLALVLILCLFLSAAAAETVVTSKKEFEVSNLQLNQLSKTFALSFTNDDGEYMNRVVDGDMNPLSGDYPSVSVTGGCFEVCTASGEYGLLDGQGKELIPAEYFDVKALNIGNNIMDGTWAIGIRASEGGNSGNYDYKTMTGPRSGPQKFYLIDTIDVYFRGEKKGSLTREDWGGSYTVYGDYISVENREGIRIFYDKDLFKARGTEGSYGEYTKDHDTGDIIHNGSGQKAFCPECTLTEDEVVQSLWIVNSGDEKKLLDLQGNVLADFSEYSNASVLSCGLIQIGDGPDHYGIADRTGKVIVPCLYDDFYFDGTTADAGYVYAKKDGKAGFVSLATGAETGFTAEESIGARCERFLLVDDENGNKIVISAAAGEIGTFKDSSYPNGPFCRLVTVQDENDVYRIIDEYGKSVLPEDVTLDSLYSAYISEDCTLIMYKPDYEHYALLTLSYDAE